MAASGVRKTVDEALKVLRTLPRVCLANVCNNPGARSLRRRGRGQHGGNKHGCGNKGAGQHQRYMRLGFEANHFPFYLRPPMEPYYQGHHLRRQYPPLSLLKLQELIDMGYIDTQLPIDLSTLCNTKMYSIVPEYKHFGVQLTDDGMNRFQAKVSIEVQWTTEPVIAAVERNGGVITTAYYDINSLFAKTNPLKFFKSGKPIPRRMLPPEDAIEYYTDAKLRGYLADPEKVAHERLVLAQKYGYQLPNLKEDPALEMLTAVKDPRQIFYGLEPGWVVNLKDKRILKPKDEHLKEYYAS